MTNPPYKAREDVLLSWLEFVSTIAAPLVPAGPVVLAGLKAIVQSDRYEGSSRLSLPPAPPSRPTGKAVAEAHLDSLLDALQQHPPADLNVETLSEILGYVELWRTYEDLHAKWLIRTNLGHPFVPFIELWHNDFSPDGAALPLEFVRSDDFTEYRSPGTTQGLGLLVDKLVQSKLKKNEPKLRIRRVEITQTRSLRLHFSMSDYRDYLRTNWAVANLKKSEALELRRALCGVKTLLPLEQSLCANDLGVSAVVVCDQEIVLPASSPEVISSPGMIVPSASGSADFLASYWYDGLPSPAQDILRETHEELKTDIRDFRDSTTRLLALTRNVLRGGKPEAFYYIHLPSRYQGTNSDEHTADAVIRLPALLTAKNLPVPDFERNLKEVVSFMHRPSRPGYVVSPFTRVALYYYLRFSIECARRAGSSSHDAEQLRTVQTTQ